MYHLALSKLVKSLKPLTILVKSSIKNASRGSKYTLRKKCPYSELFCSYSVRMLENKDQNNFKYGQFLHNDTFELPKDNPIRGSGYTRKTSWLTGMKYTSM